MERRLALSAVVLVLIVCVLTGTIGLAAPETPGTAGLRTDEQAEPVRSADLASQAARPISSDRQYEPAIAGRVMVARYGVAQGMTVQAKQGDSVRAEAVVGPDGSYVLNGLMPGTYHLVVLDQQGLPTVQVGETDSLAGREGTTTMDLLVASPAYTKEGPASRLKDQRKHGQCPRESFTAGTGSIAGTVRGVDSGTAGLSNAYVYVYQYSYYRCFSSSVRYAYTGADGKYTVTGLGTGLYLVEFVPRSGNYLGQWYNNKPGQLEATVVKVTDGVVTSNINATLAVGGSITGVVKGGDTGLGIWGVSVTVYDNLKRYVASGSTDSSGAYTVKGLRTGTYYVQFEPWYWYPGDSGRYMARFYSGKTSLDTATPITVTAPNSTTVNTFLQVGARIKGKVTGADTGTTGLAGVYVFVYDWCGRWVDYRYITTDSAGTYEFKGLPSGTYRVRYLPGGKYLSQYYSNQTSLAMANPVTVSAPNVAEGINAVLAVGGQISGKVTGANTGLGITDLEVWVYDSAGSLARGIECVGGDGHYTTGGLPNGSYRLEFGSTSGNYARQYYHDKTTLATADPVVVTAPTNHTGIDQVLPVGGQITGTVVDAGTNTPVSYVSVDVYDSSGMRVASGSTNVNGYYWIGALSTGLYKVEFDGLSAGYVVQYYDNKPTLEAATSISVTASTIRTGVDARLVKGGGISGRVTGADTGLRLLGVDVFIYGKPGVLVARTSTNGCGDWSVAGLPTGTYRVLYSPSLSGTARPYVPEWFNDKTSFGAADPIAVTAPNTRSGMDAVLALGGQITGRAREGDTGKPMCACKVYALNAKQTVTAANTGPEGYYTLFGLPTGTYRILFQPAAGTGYGMIYYYQKATFASADPLALTAPSVLAGINGFLPHLSLVSGAQKDTLQNAAEP